jgi:hypothetical protein
MELFQKPLQDVKLATSDISQQTFDKIASHIEKEQMDSAIEMIQEALEEGNFDIRLISYYFYADFLRSGVKSFKETFPIFMRLVKDHWEILRPFHRKEKQLESSFNWFFTQVNSKLKYNERLCKENKEPIWPLHVLQLSPQEHDELQETMASFSRFFYERWARSSGKDRVTNLVKKIADLKPLMDEPAFVEDQEEPDVEEAAEMRSESLEVKLEEKTQPTSSCDPSPFETAEMLGLLNKLKIFEALAEKRKFLKAAVVSTDILKEIASFDPCSYFPKLFSAHFNLLARHSSSIAEQSESQESLEWKSLERLYKTDLDQFIEW